MTELERPLLLVVTDSTVKRAFFHKHFGDEFYLAFCSSEEETLDYLKMSKVSVIVIDEKCQNLSLFKFCEKIRHFLGYENIPLLVITSQLKKSYIQKLLACGVSDLIREPLDEGELIQRLELAKRFHQTHKKMGTLSKAITSPSSETTYSLNQSALEAFTDAQKNKEMISILMLEVDMFDQIISTWGELIGEELLIHLQSDIEDALRIQDKLIPMGKGKFIIILPKTPNQAAKHIAEELKHRISQKAYSTKQTSLHVTTSIGLVTHEEKSKTNAYHDLNSLLKQVTNYLNEAKKKGNQIISDENLS